MIDAFAHLYPPSYINYIQKLNSPLPVFLQNAPPYVDSEFRVQELDRWGIDRQAVALGTPAYDDLFAPDQIALARETARIGNDGIAEIVAKYPKRFIGVATLPLISSTSVDAALEELERAIGPLNLKAVQLYTRCAGKPIDLPEFFPLYQKIVEHDIPILLHPTGGSDNVAARDYLLWLTFGWPFETCLTMARLVYSGVLEKFPRIKILTHHLGAFVPFMAERIKGVTATLERSSDWRLPQPVLTYFKQFYADTAVNGYMPALTTGYQFFGADRVLFGTDAPFVPVGPQVQALLDWDLPARDKEKILDENARQFFKL